MCILPPSVHNPFFSVIIPTYNRAHLVGETIESFLKQTFKNFELIIVDDGSTDNTKEVIHKYLSDPRVKYIYQENKERGAARNRGAKEAKGLYLNFFDSDDIALTDHLQKAYELIMKYGIDKVKWMHGNYSSFINGKILEPIHKKTISGNITKQLLKGNIILLCTMIIKKEFFDGILFYEGKEVSVSEDWVFAIKASLNAPIFFQPEVTVLIRHHSGRTMVQPNLVKNLFFTIDRFLSDEQIKTSLIMKYKKRIYSHGYLTIALTHFSSNDILNAKSYFQKSIKAYPLNIFRSLYLKWLLRLYVIPMSNFQKRFIKVLYLTYNGLCQPLGQSQVIPYIIGLSKQGYKFTVLSFEHHYEKDLKRSIKR